METSLAIPLFSPIPDSFHSLSGEVAVSKLLLAVTRCKKYVSDGRRMENLSWRIWFRDYHSPATVTGVHAAPTYASAGCVGPSQPNDDSTTLLSPSSPRQSMIAPVSDGDLTTSCTALSQLKPLPTGKTIDAILSQKLSLMPLEELSQMRKDEESAPLHHSPLPVLLMPCASPASREGAPLAPRVVIVNPTPHPTPPATPYNRYPGATANRLYAGDFLAPLQLPEAMEISDLSGALEESPIPAPSPATPSTHGSSSTPSSDEHPTNGKLFYVSNAASQSHSPDDIPPLPSPNSANVVPPQLEPPTHPLDPSLQDDRIRLEASSATSSGSILSQSRKEKKPGPRQQSRSRTRAKFAVGTASSKSSTSGPRMKAHEIAQEKRTSVGFAESMSNRSRTFHTAPSGSKRAGFKHQRRTSAQLSKRASPETKAVLQRVQTQPLPHAHRPLRAYNHVLKLQAHHIAEPLVPRTNGKRRVEIVSTSSEEESGDGSEWSSVDDETVPERPESPERRPPPPAPEAKPPDQLSKAAAEAARQRELFRRRSPSEYIPKAHQVQTGLLSNLFRPDPNLFPEGHPYRTSLSHHDLVAKAGVPGRGPTLYYNATNHMNNQPASSNIPSQKPKISPPTAAVRLSSSRSAVALPEMTNITVGSIATNGSSRSIVSPSKSSGTIPTTPARSGSRPNAPREVYRPRGRPADVELSDSDEDDPENSVQVETSVAHKRLAEIAQRKRSQPTPGEKLALHTDAGREPQPLPHQSPTIPRTRPVAIGYPYNLPAPTPPLSPNAQRRKMYWEECGISLLKHMNHERAEGYGLLHEGVRFVKDKETREVQAEERRNRLQRNKSWAADDFHTRGW